MARFELDYKKFKDAVLLRDNYTCNICGIKGANEIAPIPPANLNVVHELMPNIGITVNINAPDKTITVCHTCKVDLENKYYTELNKPLKVKILEYYNYKCGYCGEFASEVIKNDEYLKKSTYLSGNEKGTLNNDVSFTRYIAICDKCKLETITPIDFEKLVGLAFEKSGYIVELTVVTGDHGIDLICKHPDRDEKIIVQCKKYKGTVGEPALRDFYGAIIDSGADKGYFITTGKFTEPAKNWAKFKNIILIDKLTLSEFLINGL